MPGTWFLVRGTWYLVPGTWYIQTTKIEEPFPNAGTLERTDMNTTQDDNTYNQRFLWSTTLVAAMGGFLFGYDWVVVGGAKPFFELHFELTTAGQLVRAAVLWQLETLGGNLSEAA